MEKNHRTYSEYNHRLALFTQYIVPLLTLFFAFIHFPFNSSAIWICNNVRGCLSTGSSVRPFHLRHPNSRRCHQLCVSFQETQRCSLQDNWSLVSYPKMGHQNFSTGQRLRVGVHFWVHPKLLYRLRYAPDRGSLGVGTLTGYINNSLSSIHTADILRFEAGSEPADPHANLPYNHSFCRYEFLPFLWQFSGSRTLYSGTEAKLKRSVICQLGCNFESVHSCGNA